MKKKTAVCYAVVCLLVFIWSIRCNQEYFYRLAYDNLISYQIRQAASVFVLYIIGYSFMKAVQQTFNERWVVLLAMPCGAAVWVFTGQFLMLSGLPYHMFSNLLCIAIIITGIVICRHRKNKSFRLKVLPDHVALLIIVGTSFLVSTGFNYINMNYDSYLYFTDYGKMMAIAGDYQAWNSKNAFVITNIGQFLPTLNSYSALWGLEYCLPIQSFLVLNLGAIFAQGIYERSDTIVVSKKRVAYTVLLTTAFISCTCVVVFANWMLSNSFIMYYITIIGILGVNVPEETGADYLLVLLGSCTAITLLRKDGIVLVCFLLVCYCCHKVLRPRALAACLMVPAAAQLYYIGYLRLFLKPETHTARGTSLLSDKFVLMILAAIMATWIYLFFIHDYFEKYVKYNLYKVILIIMTITAIAAIAIKPEASYNHIDAILEVLASPAYGFSVILWLVLLAIMLTDKMKPDYEMFLVIGYCILTFLIYWNKGNKEQGIDNSGMRTFVQIVPMIFFWAGGYVKDRWKGMAGNIETGAKKETIHDV